MITTSGLIDSIARTTQFIEKSDFLNKDKMVKVIQQATRFLSDHSHNPDVTREMGAAITDLQGRLVSKQDATSLISEIDLLTSDVCSSIVEIVPEESGGLRSRPAKTTRGRPPAPVEPPARTTAGGAGRPGRGRAACAPSTRGRPPSTSSCRRRRRRKDLPAARA